MDKVEKINNKNCIKSPYVLKGIFSFLSQRQTMDIIKYNKKLQKLFNYDDVTYKKISGKYKVGEKNGKGKEYILNTDWLKFEGEYLNGRKNGNGKEYHYGDLIFEGEYLNGK